MVSKIILRMALALALASSLWAGNDAKWNGVVTPSDAMNDGWETITIPIHELFVRQPGTPLDAFDTTIKVTDFELNDGGWVSGDLTTGLAPYWHSDAGVPIGDANAPSWWCGDAQWTDNAVAPGGYDNHRQEYLTSPSLDLSSASAPVTLGFKARWKVEAPGGEPAPYNFWDGWNVQASTDGGTTWTVVTTLNAGTPAFTGNCGYAWGDHCYTGCFPGWGGQVYAAAYVAMSLDLSAYAGQSDVLFRYAFLSDPGFSSAQAPPDGDPTMYGLIVDSIRVTDASSTLLSNDGTGGGFVASTVPSSGFGDTWAYENNGPTGMTAIPDQSWSWHASHNGIAQLNTELTSPLIQLPDTATPTGNPAGYQKLKLSYYVWGDLTDQDGDNDGSLDDLWNVFVSTDSVNWTRIGYDYAYDNSETHPDAGDAGLGWVRRTKGLASGGTSVELLLTQWGDQQIYLRFSVTTDCNDDGGIGTGLHIDYIGIDATRAYPNDAAAQNITVPFPTTVGLARPWSFQWANVGSNTLTNYTIRWKEQIKRPDGTVQVNTPLAQLTGINLNPNEAYTVNRSNWTPDVVGCYVIMDSTAMTGDGDASNNRTFSPTNVPASGSQNLAIEVMPAGTYELGHHMRDLSVVLSNPRLCRYNAAEVGVPAASADTVDITQFQVMFNYDLDMLTLPGETATLRLNFYGQGPDNRTPGALLYTYEEEIDTSECINFVQPLQWKTINLASVYALKRLVGDVWVEVMGMDTVAGSGLPGLLALVTDPQDTTDTRNYTRRLDIVGLPILASPSRYMMELTVVPTTVADPVIHLTVIRVFGTNDVKLDWPVSNRATSYNVYRSNDPNNPLQSLLGNVATNTYTDVGAVTAGDKWFYVVEALPHP